MEQVYIPKINTRAYPAMCLQYIDDAGDAPSRSPTAKAAYIKEKNAKRIRTNDLPENIWVVVWFEFTKGSYRYPDGSVVYYKDAWHIAFARRRGKTIEIHDSEVHSGARQPYTSLAQVEAWFAVYGTRYVGWSTQCDGRIYAKEAIMPNEKDVKDYFKVWENRTPTKSELKDYTSKSWRYLVDKLLAAQKDRYQKEIKKQTSAKSIAVTKATVVDYISKNLK